MTHKTTDIKKTPDRPGRRGFLSAVAALGAGAVIAPGVMLYQTGKAGAKTDNLGKPFDNAGKAANPATRWGLLVDTNKCPENCTVCVSACARENGLESKGRPETDAQWIRKVDIKNPSTGREMSLPVMCQHCSEPPCVDVCPTGASFKRVDGIVLVDKHTCIGCRYCMMACPYKARSFIHETLENQKPTTPRGKGTVESCTFCVHRIDVGRRPACVEACARDAGGAMTFGDMNDPNSEISKLLEKYSSQQIRRDLGTDPGVHYQGLSI